VGEPASAKFRIVEGVPQSLRKRIERFLAANGVEIAGVELIADTAGRLLVYDVNTNTNYNAEAEEREGRTGTSRSGPGAITQFLEAELDRLQAKAA
jgi:hypothetical protein